MNLTLLIAFCIAALVALAFALAFRRIGERDRRLPTSGEWIAGLSVARYRPMERLLDEADIQFAAAAPGCGRQLARRLRSQRRRLFRGYLHCLSRDFHRICTAIQILALESQQDRPDLATLLFKQKLIFSLSMSVVQYRLFLHMLGLSSVDVRSLLSSLECMRLELRQLVPVAAVAAV